MIIDASVLLSAFFPDESQEQAQAILHAHVTGLEWLKAPALAVYEVSNAVWQAERRKRISSDQADEILRTVAGLDIELISLEWGEMLPMRRQYNCSAYDAAYLCLAQRCGEELVTGDRHLYNAVKDRLDWVTWMGNTLFE
jgi:predicted nucleic acid-binding protein